MLTRNQSDCWNACRITRFWDSRGNRDVQSRNRDFRRGNITNTKRMDKRARGSARWSLRWRTERGREGEAGARPITVQEFARQEHYYEKMFRDCALERDVFGSLVHAPPVLPSLLRHSPHWRLPCFILATTLSSDRLPRTATFVVLVFPFRSFSFKRHVSRTNGAKKIGMCILEDIDYVPVIRTHFCCTKRSPCRCEWRPRGRGRRRGLEMLASIDLLRGSLLAARLLRDRL